MFCTKWWALWSNLLSMPLTLTYNTGVPTWSSATRGVIVSWDRGGGGRWNYCAALWRLISTALWLLFFCRTCPRCRRWRSSFWFIGSISVLRWRVVTCGGLRGQEVGGIYDVAGNFSNSLCENSDALGFAMFRTQPQHLPTG